MAQGGGISRNVRLVEDLQSAVRLLIIRWMRVWPSWLNTRLWGGINV